MWRTATNLLLIGYALFVATMTHIPLPADEMFPGVWDKHLHLLAYGGLGAVVALRLIAHASASPVWWIWWGALLLAGVVDEVSQPVVGRIADVNDWYADAIGLTLGMAALAGLCRAANRARSVKQTRREVGATHTG